MVIGYLSFFFWKYFVYSVVIFLIFFVFSRCCFFARDVLRTSVFLQLLACLFHTLYTALWWTGILSSYSRRICVLFFFIVRTFLCLVSEILLSSKVIEIPKKFSSQNFKVLLSTFRSLITISFISVYSMVWGRYLILFFHMYYAIALVLFIELDHLCSLPPLSPVCFWPLYSVKVLFPCANTILPELQ